DAMVAIQALGSYPVALAGSDDLKKRFLPGVANGSKISAFAMTETGAGSDAAAIATRAKKDGAAWALDGEKVFISNAGIADGYVVFARTSDDGPKGISAFFLEPGAGLTTKPTQLIAPHPLGTVTLSGARGT